jgi:hypothetical protein
MEMEKDNTTEILNDEEKRIKRREYMRQYMQHRRKTVVTENGKSYDNFKLRLNYEYRQRESIRLKKYFDKKREWKKFQKSMPHFLTA